MQPAISLQAFNSYPDQKRVMKYQFYGCTIYLNIKQYKTTEKSTEKQVNHMQIYDSIITDNSNHRYSCRDHFIFREFKFK